MKKYRTQWEKIEYVEIDRETAKMVVLLGGRKEAKRSDWSNWHDSFEEAKQFLIDKEEGKIKDLRLRLEHEKGKLGSIKGLKDNA